MIDIHWRCIVNLNYYAYRCACWAIWFDFVFFFCFICRQRKSNIPHQTKCRNATQMPTMTFSSIWTVWIRATAICHKWRNRMMKMSMMTKILVCRNRWTESGHFLDFIDLFLTLCFLEDSYVRNGGIKITPTARKGMKTIVAQSLPMAVPIFNQRNEDDYDEVNYTNGQLIGHTTQFAVAFSLPSLIINSFFGFFFTFYSHFFIFNSEN